MFYKYYKRGPGFSTDIECRDYHTTGSKVKRYFVNEKGLSGSHESWCVAHEVSTPTTKVPSPTCSFFLFYWSTFSNEERRFGPLRTFRRRSLFWPPKTLVLRSSQYRRKGFDLDFVPWTTTHTDTRGVFNLTVFSRMKFTRRPPSTRGVGLYGRVSQFYTYFRDTVVIDWDLEKYSRKKKPTVMKINCVLTCINTQVTLYNYVHTLHITSLIPLIT